MENQKSKIHNDIADYYSAKILEHGNTAEGVDWNGEESQTLRFEQLCRIIKEDGAFSVADIGCGYGAVLDHIEKNYAEFEYLGIDISGEMIEAAKQKYQNLNKASFELGATPSRTSDYCIASGILNVRLHNDEDVWRRYFYDTLDLLDQYSRKGFSFNCLTSYSDVDKMRDYLFYANPAEVFDHCKRRYSRNVALLHDYELYEFTILVRKT